LLVFENDRERRGYEFAAKSFSHHLFKLKTFSTAVYLGLARRTFLLFPLSEQGQVTQLAIVKNGIDHLRNGNQRQHS